MGVTYLHRTMMGLFPVLRWILLTSSIVSVTAFRLEQVPSPFQHVKWNWVTDWAFWDCKRKHEVILSVWHIDMPH